MSEEKLTKSAVYQIVGEVSQFGVAWLMDGDDEQQREAFEEQLKQWNIRVEISFNPIGDSLGNGCQDAYYAMSENFDSEAWAVEGDESENLPQGWDRDIA